MTASTKGESMNNLTLLYQNNEMFRNVADVFANAAMADEGLFGQRADEWLLGNRRDESEVSIPERAPIQIVIKGKEETKPRPPLDHTTLIDEFLASEKTSTEIRCQTHAEASELAARMRSRISRASLPCRVTKHKSDITLTKTDFAPIPRTTTALGNKTRSKARLILDDFIASGEASHIIQCDSTKLANTDIHSMRSAIRRHNLPAYVSQCGRTISIYRTSYEETTENATQKRISRNKNAIDIFIESRKARHTFEYDDVIELNKDYNNMCVQVSNRRLPLQVQRKENTITITRDKQRWTDADSTQMNITFSEESAEPVLNLNEFCPTNGVSSSMFQRFLLCEKASMTIHSNNSYQAQRIANNLRCYLKTHTAPVPIYIIKHGNSVTLERRSTHERIQQQAEKLALEAPPLTEAQKTRLLQLLAPAN